MITENIKNPNLGMTLLFFAVAILSFIGLQNHAASNDDGFNLLGKSLLVLGNIGFWGMIYRISKHTEFYLQGQPGAGFSRIIILVSFVITFIFLFSYGYAQFKKPVYTSSLHSDPFEELKKETEDQKRPLNK